MNKMIFALSMVAVAAAGCSTMPRQEARHAGNLGVESRGASSVHPKRARALVSGPVVVKHLETEGDGAVTLYLADDPGIADRACPSAPAENEAPIAFLERDEPPHRSGRSGRQADLCRRQRHAHDDGDAGTRARPTTRRRSPSTSRCARRSTRRDTGGKAR